MLQNHKILFIHAKFKVQSINQQINCCTERQHHQEETYWKSFIIANWCRINASLENYNMTILFAIVDNDIFYMHYCSCTLFPLIFNGSIVINAMLVLSLNVLIYMLQTKLYLEFHIVNCNDVF